MNPQKPILDLSSDPNITVTGMVEDVRPYIASASVCIVPLLSGSGTRLKILEAMAMGKSVISTSVGCEGIDVTHEKNIIIADEPSDFARWCIELLRNAELRITLGQEGRKLVEAKYSWRSICASLEEFYISQLS
jgi:glycosyltransferase involved in cell wall biosynthesis